MTTGRLPASPGRRPRRELLLVLLLGVAGAGLVLLVMRQSWARVETAAPRPLPASVVTVSGQALAPAASALALAALAGLAAVLATRRMLRRIAGVLLAGFGAGIAAVVVAGISTADVLAAATIAVGAQDGAGAGSTTGSTAAGAAGTLLSGLPGHVAFISVPWRAAAVAGALAVIATGLLVAWRAERLPVMSSRFERSDRAAAVGPPDPADDRGRTARDSASMWESLSRGEDPTGGG